jgi:hypothetical protein
VVADSVLSTKERGEVFDGLMNRFPSTGPASTSECFSQI